MVEWGSPVKKWGMGGEVRAGRLSVRAGRGGMVAGGLRMGQN